MNLNNRPFMGYLPRNLAGFGALLLLACGSSSPTTGGAAGSSSPGAGGSSTSAGGAGGGAAGGSATGGSATGSGGASAGGAPSGGGVDAAIQAGGSAGGGAAVFDAAGSGGARPDAAVVTDAAGGGTRVTDAQPDTPRPTNPDAEGGPPIVDLFNGVDLTGWSVNREVTAPQAPGTVLTTAEALLIFKPENGTIRVYGDQPDQSTQHRHTMVSNRSYSKYRLWFEYMWGTKKFAPYTDLTLFPRDAGLLWHMHGDLTQVWPSSIEFQVKDGTTGDIFALYARCTSLALGGGTTFVEGGTPKLVDGSNGFVQHSRSANFELPGWNALELDVGTDAMGNSTAVYWVNGNIVNRVLNVMDRNGRPVTSGPIALQAEHAEVFYRNIRIQVLP